MTFFATDKQCCERLGIGEDRWRRLVATYGHQHAFMKDPVVGMRVWPAIEKFLLEKAGVGASMAEHDGKENWS